jgi:hypothetical protein
MLDVISFYSFYFLAVLCIIFIMLQHSDKNLLLFIFIAGSICCQLLNIFLKNLIAEPLDPSVFPNRTVNIYANPSGHAQMNAFCVCFLLFITTSEKSSILISILSIVIYLLSVVTCINNRYHTYDQLFLGTIIGLLFGICCGFIYIKLKK